MSLTGFVPAISRNEFVPASAESLLRFVWPALAHLIKAPTNDRKSVLFMIKGFDRLSNPKQNATTDDLAHVHRAYLLLDATVRSPDCSAHLVTLQNIIHGHVASASQSHLLNVFISQYTARNNSAPSGLASLYPMSSLSSRDKFLQLRLFTS